MTTMRCLTAVAVAIAASLLGAQTARAVEAVNVRLDAAAIDLTDVTQRAALLDRECAGDAELRRRVEILLTAHDDSPGLHRAGAGWNRAAH